MPKAFIDKIYTSHKNILFFSISAFMLSMLLFLLFDNNNTFSMIVSLVSTNHTHVNKVAKIILTIGTAFISYLSVSICLLSQGRIILYMGVLLFSFGVINFFTYFITGTPLNSVHLRIAVQNFHFSEMFLMFTWKLILMSVVASAIFLYLLSWFRRKLNFEIKNSFILLLVLLSLAANILFDSYPSYRRIPFYAYNLPIAIVRAIDSQKVYIQRDKVPALSVESSSPDIVMLIIDESVNYEALLSYGSLISKTNELSRKINSPVFLFKAHSAGNHSMVSNYILRLGADKSFYPDKEGKTLSFPTIFSYAKAAKYKTIFYDAQSEQNKLQNLMSQFDLADIDLFLTSDPSIKLFQRDNEAVKKMTDIISSASSKGKVMITIIKNGIHFPYIHSIPEHLIDDFPEPCKSRFPLFSNMNKSCLKIQYEAALKHSVDSFIDSILNMVYGKKFAIIYTSDHGQNLNSKYEYPHGSFENVSECEISVPILLIGDSFDTIEQNGEIKSHFQIPATLKSIMGFASELGHNEITLWERWHNDSTFLHDPFDKTGHWFKTVRDCEY